jgi:hypothetical protein
MPTRGSYLYMEVMGHLNPVYGCNFLPFMIVVYLDLVYIFLRSVKNSGRAISLPVCWSIWPCSVCYRRCLNSIVFTSLSSAVKYLSLVCMTLLRHPSSQDCSSREHYKKVHVCRIIIFPLVCVNLHVYMCIPVGFSLYMYSIPVYIATCRCIKCYVPVWYMRSERKTWTIFWGLW